MPESGVDWDSLFSPAEFVVEPLDEERDMVASVALSIIEDCDCEELHRLSVMLERF